MNHLQKRMLMGYIFVAPAVTVIVLFVLVPLVLGFINSLHTGFLTDLTFIGFRNYRDLFTDRSFWNSLKVTSIFTVSYTLLSTLIGFATASWLVNKRVRFNQVFSTFIVLPFVVTPAVATLVWQYMYDFTFGILNSLIVSVGLDPVPWLRTPELAMLSLIIVQVWFTMGYNAILLAAGIQGIPTAYFEAAEIDGANAIQKAARITFPLILPSIVFVLVLSLLGGFVNSFVLAQIVTGGGPFGSTQVLMLLIYRTAFSIFDFPYANTMTTIMFILMLVLSLLLNAWQNRVYKGLF